jgi:hypothetical protein
MLSHDRKISGGQRASSLLRLPTCYTARDRFVNVNLHWVKVHRHKPYGLLKPLPVPDNPFEIITMDFITGLPRSEWEGRSYDAVLVIFCALTKYAVFMLPVKRILTPKDWQNY